jgi:hypothetical protein
MKLFPQAFDARPTYRQGRGESKATADHSAAGAPVPAPAAPVGDLVTPSWLAASVKDRCRSRHCREANAARRLCGEAKRRGLGRDADQRQSSARAAGRYGGWPAPGV